MIGRIVVELAKPDYQPFKMPANMRRRFSVLLQKLTGQPLHGGDSSTYVPFVFSDPKVLDGDIRAEVKRFQVKIDSPKDEILDMIFQGFVKASSIRLGEETFEITRLTTEAYPDFTGGELMVKAISPIVIYITLENLRLYLSPLDHVPWGQLLAASLRRKTAAIWGLSEAEVADMPFEILPVAVKGEIRLKKGKPTTSGNLKTVVYYKDEHNYTVFKGWTGLYLLKGHPLMLQMAYRGGIGSRSGIGFGMLEAWKKNPQPSAGSGP